MKSMTGYSSSERSINNGKVLVEIRSENHRFLDCKLQISDSLNSSEHEFLKLIKKSISRGKLKVVILIESKNGRFPNFNKEMGKQFTKDLKSFVSDLGIKDEVGLNHLLAFKELFANNFNDQLSESSLVKVRDTLIAALKNLDANRGNEGKKLKKELIKRIKICESHVRRVKRKRNNFSQQAFKKLKVKVGTLLKDVSVDNQRLYQEIAIQTERSDITEELVRLDAHIEKFTETLEKSVPIGKELDFLVQEMNREAGTISAKSKDAVISHHVIDLRSELEKIREQIQNIE